MADGQALSTRDFHCVCVDRRPRITLTGHPGNKSHTSQRRYGQSQPDKERGKPIMLDAWQHRSKQASAGVEERALDKRELDRTSMNITPSGAGIMQAPSRWQ